MCHKVKPVGHFGDQTLHSDWLLYLLTLCQLERVLTHLHIMYEQYFSVVDLFTFSMMAILARKKETFVNQYFNLHIFVNEMKLWGNMWCWPTFSKRLIFYSKHYLKRCILC